MILYLDTSTLVKLYVEEAGSPGVRRLAEQASQLASSLIAYAEMKAATGRKNRLGELSARLFAVVQQDFDRDWSSYMVVPVGDSLVRSAGELAQRHGLRALDAIHLASAVYLAQRIGEPLVFSCADSALRTAAEGEDLRVV